MKGCNVRVLTKICWSEPETTAQTTPSLELLHSHVILEVETGCSLCKDAIELKSDFISKEEPTVGPVHADKGEHLSN